jgi:hypothetical protein
MQLVQVDVGTDEELVVIGGADELVEGGVAGARIVVVAAAQNVDEPLGFRLMSPTLAGSGDREPRQVSRRPGSKFAKKTRDSARSARELGQR